MIDPDVRKFIVGKTITNISEHGESIIIEFGDGEHIWIESMFDFEYVGIHPEYSPVAKAPVVHLGLYGDTK